MTGIMAAKTLQDNGFNNFIILEGSDRVGGRIKEGKIGNVPVSLGSLYISSYKQNPLYEIIKKLNMKGKEADYESYTFRADGGADVTDKADDMYDTLADAVGKTVALSKKRQQNNGRDMTLRDSYTMFGWKPRSPVEHAMEYWEADDDNGEIPELTSMKYGGWVPSYKWGMDEDFHISDERGFSYLLTHLAGALLNDTRLKLNEVVNKIDYSSEKVTVQTKANNTYEADLVLVTFSNGVLQNDVVDFSPDLPAWKQEVILRMHMAHETVIYLKWPLSTPRFWDDTEFILYCSLWKGYYTTWQNLEAGGLYPNDTNTLLVVVSEWESHRLYAMTDEQILNETVSILSEMYGRPIARPSEILVSRWNEDPLHHGAFCNWPVGFGMEDFRAFTAPVKNVYFGGDCHSPDFGFLHTAYQSGIDKAKEMLSCMGDGKCASFNYDTPPHPRCD